MKNYRNDVSIAVNFFRPVLSKLNIRNKEKQEQFKILLEKADNESVQEGLSLYMETIKKVAELKSVPLNFAKKQALSWAKTYLK